MATKKNNKTAPQEAPKKTDTKSETIVVQKSSPLAVLVAAGLLFVIGGSVLVGLGVVKLPTQSTDIEILGQDAYEKQPRTPLVARSERDDTITETSIELLDAPEEATIAVVDVEAPNSTEVADLKKVVEAQQQMLRMMAQQQEEQVKRQEAQTIKLGLAIDELRKASAKSDLTIIENHIGRLYLLQGVANLRQMWEDGILTPEILEGWAQQAGAKGFVDAQQLAMMLAAVVQNDGVLNAQNLHHRVIQLQKTFKASQQAAKEVEAEQSFWAYLKAKFFTLVKIERDAPTLDEEFAEPLSAGDAAAFNAQLSKVEAETPLVEKMKYFTESHMNQKLAFTKLYEALAMDPTPAPKVKAVIITEDVKKAE